MTAVAEVVAPARGPCGIVGHGSPGKRLRQYARANRIAPLRKFVRFSVAGKDAPTSEFESDCLRWMQSKGIKP